MKNLFASASYSFNNFYNNLTTPGQMIFSVIMFLIMVLCLLLFLTYIIQSLSSKKRIIKLKEKIKNNHFKMIKEEDKEEIKEEISKKTDIKDIANAINNALKEDPITLTNFEEDQEKTAIISIDELMKKAKDLELIDDDEQTGVNYLEKYNLEPAEVVKPKTDDTLNKEVKAFKVSQVISPIYGVKKEIINNDRKA